MDGAKSGPSTDVPRGSVPADSNPEGGPAPPESIDVEQFKREAAAFAQQMVDWVGRDTPEVKAILRDLELEMAPIPRPTNAEPEQTQLIDLRLLEDSRLHHRTWPSSEEQTALERSIAANGLKHPIEVRPRGDKFEIICGHRRANAYRALLERATTDSERAKYQAIRAKVLPASDLQAVGSGIAEDLVREEFPPADAARSIHMLRHFAPKLWSAQKLSDATGLPVRRVARYLQLGKAALVVQAAVRDGMTVQVDGEDGSAHEEDRKLDLLAGLEFDRLHAALSKREGARDRSTKRAPPEGPSRGDRARASEEASTADDGPESSDDTDGGESSNERGSSSGNEESAADRKTRQAIERALCENWGLREVKRYVDKAIAALEAPTAKMGRPRVPFKWSKRRLQVDVDQLDALDASQKQQLRTVIQEILTRL